MIKKTGSALILLILFPAVLFAQLDESLNSYVNDTSFQHAGISICVRDVESGEILEAYNEDMALTSASVMKLVTTGTSLEIMGPSFVYNTRVGYAGFLEKGTLRGYVIIRGGGDPSLGSEYFPEHYGDFINEWAESISKAGIKKIEGRVLADASIFAYHPAAPGWSWGDLGNYYGAGVHGLSVFDNMYRIYFKTGSEGTVPEIIGTEPDIPGLTIVNQLTAKGRSDKGYVYLQPYGNYAEIKGTIPIKKDSFALKASIPDPPLLAANLLNNKLKELDIDISGSPSTIKDFRSQLDNRFLSNIVITHSTKSPPLSELISTTNLESVNLYAENFAWTLDHLINGGENAYLKKGIEIITKYLESKGLSTDGLYMTDGSGLSRSDALSAAFISSYLVFMHREAKYPDIFKSSLAVPGKGTLEYYFLNPIFKNKLRAKSGTVSRARNYAGYLTAKSGRQLAFGVLNNNFDCTTTEVSSRVEKLLEDIYNKY